MATCCIKHDNFFNADLKIYGGGSSCSSPPLHEFEPEYNVEGS